MPNSKINDIGLWRTVINGYPYKSISELGVANKEEAFTATKQAIYCYLFENTPDDYEGIGEEGDRTLNALRTIVNNSENSTELQMSNTFTIETENNEWIEDQTYKNYVSKTYSINSVSNYTDYDVSITGNLPEGTKIIKLDGTESSKFSQNEKFKILLLKENLNQEGKFTINIDTEVKVKPVIYGASPDGSLQNYALTAYMYEDSSNEYEDTYPKFEKPQEPEQLKIPEEYKAPKPEENIKKLKILPVTGM